MLAQATVIAPHVRDLERADRGLPSCVTFRIGKLCIQEADAAASGSPEP